MCPVSQSKSHKQMKSIKSDSQVKNWVASPYLKISTRVLIIPGKNKFKRTHYLAPNTKSATYHMCSHKNPITCVFHDQKLPNQHTLAFNYPSLPSYE